MSNSKKYNIVPRQDIKAETWDSFVHSCDECWLWHTSDFLDIFQSWRNQEDISCAVTNASHEILALVPLNFQWERYRKILKHYSLNSLGGIAFSATLSKKKRAEILSVIESIYPQKAKYINCIIPTLTPSVIDGHHNGVNPLIHMGFDNRLSQTCILDLALPFDNLIQNMSQTTRQQIKKMDDVTISAATANDLDLYYDMHCETYKRTHITPHPYDYFKGIFERMIPKGYSHILKLDYKGETLAMKNCAMYKNGSYYWTGASKNNIDGGFNRLLMLEQIKHAQKSGHQWFEAGEVFPCSQDKKKAGLTLYKSSFGGEYYPFYKGRKELQ